MLQRLGFACLIALTATLFDAHALGAHAADAKPSDDASRDVLVKRLEQIDLDLQASVASLEKDRVACADLLRVSSCTSQAAQRKRARDQVLHANQDETRQQIRSLAAKRKNEAIANTLPDASKSSEEAGRREQFRQDRAKRLADLDQRRADHEAKKANEELARAAYAKKQEAAAAKQAQIRARLAQQKAQAEPTAQDVAVLEPRR